MSHEEMDEQASDATGTWEGWTGEVGAWGLPERWRVTKQLGSGGQSEVWLAHDREVDQWVAVKVFKEATSPEQLERLRREVYLGRTLQHPGLVRVYELIESEGRIAVAMEWMPRGTVAGRLREGPLPVEEVVAVAEQCLEILAYLHGRRVVHRDVKPSNLLLDADGQVRLADLGLARPLDDDRGLTRTTVALGTRDYMSPDQLRGGEPSPTWDLYALGATLYHLLTEEKPYPTTSDYGLAELHRRSAPPDPRKLRPETPRWLAKFVRRLMEPRAEDRWPDAAGALGAFRARRGLTSPRTLRRAACAAGILVVAGGTVPWLAGLGPARPDSVELVGEVVVARDRGGEELWRWAPQGQPALTMVADVVGGTRKEVVVTTHNGLGTWGSREAITVLSPSGQEIGSFPALGAGGWRVFGETPPACRVRRLASGDLDGDGRPDLVWLAIHPVWSPSVVQAWRARGGASPSVLLHSSGHVNEVEVLDVDGDGVDEIVVAGVNNPLGYQLFAAVIDPGSDAGLRGSSPDLAREGALASGPMTLYALLGPVESTVYRLSPEGVSLESEDAVTRIGLGSLPGWAEVAAGGAVADPWRDLVTSSLEVERGLSSVGDAMAGIGLAHPKWFGHGPHDLAAALLLARSAARSGQPDAAAQLLTEVGGRHPDASELLVRLAVYRAIAGEAERAYEAAHRVIAGPEFDGPPRMNALVVIARVAAVSGDREEALRALRTRESLRGEPSPAEVRDGVDALDAFFRGRWEDPSLDPAEPWAGLPDARVVQAWAAIERGAADEQVDALVSEVAERPETASLAPLLEARRLLARGAPERALGTVDGVRDEIALRAREEIRSWMWLPAAEWVQSRALEALGRRSEAETLVARACAAAPAAWFCGVER